MENQQQISAEAVKRLDQLQVKLPKRSIFKTPRILLADAYTIGSNEFQSPEAIKNSVYYATFRRPLYKVSPLYSKGDDRIIFVGLSRILEKLFYDPVTHAEIDEAKRFLAQARVTTRGLASYYFPEHLWRRIVDEFNGRPPIKIKGFREGSTVYPNEPLLQCSSGVEGFGEFAAWFESKLLHVWASSERATQGRHWFEEMCRMVRKIEPDLTSEQVDFNASLMLHDFGDRAGMTLEESEEQGMWHLLSWTGTDTFSGAYQAWKNGGEVPGLAVSVAALAHRNVQAYLREEDCYRHMYETAADGDILSQVADCYDFYYAVENYQLPLAIRARDEKSGKIIVSRPDSGDALEQVTWICRLAKRHGLYTERVIKGKTWYFSTNLKFIEGDGMSFEQMRQINDALMEQGFVPYSWGLYGVGGGLRNGLKRDDFSAKYALCSVDGRPVVKFSEDLGKTTLPGPFKVRRDTASLELKRTIAFDDEEGVDAHVEYFDGARIDRPFGPGQDFDFVEVKRRVLEEFRVMPPTLWTEENHGYPASNLVRRARLELMQRYAPKKRKENY